MNATQTHSQSHSVQRPHGSRWPVLLFVGLFALCSFLNLSPVNDDSFCSVVGGFHLLRRVQGLGPQPFSDYLQAAWQANRDVSADLGYAWNYHGRFSFGFVYPLMGILYPFLAEGIRHLLPPDANYVELLVRAGSLAMTLSWLLLISLVAWGIGRIREPGLRASLAAAASAAVVFDYLVYTNYRAIFYGHPIFGYVHDGFLFAMTMWAPRAAVSVLVGLYLAARALEAEGSRWWLIPAAFLFHLGSAMTVAGVLLVAEALICVIRRILTKDLLVLGVCTLAGLMVSAAFGSSGYPVSRTGVLPPGTLLLSVLWYGLSHPTSKFLLLFALGAISFVVGIVQAIRRSNSHAVVFLVLALMSGVWCIELSTGRAIAAGLFTWYDNPSIHSLLYIFTYSSSAVALGVTLWLFVRGGRWLASRPWVRLSPPAATAGVATFSLLITFGIAVMTAPKPVRALTVIPRHAVGELFLEVVQPQRWCQGFYTQMAPRQPAVPYLTFDDRRLWVGKDWLFNAIVYLRDLHQEAVFGPIVGEPKIQPRPMVLDTRSAQRVIVSRP